MPYISSFALEQIDDTLFVLLKDLIYIDPILHIKVTVPAGFVSDGPSVPRAPFIYWLAGNKGKRAGVTHDYLYRNKILSRETDDLIFYHALKEHSQIQNYIAYAMYKAVRIFGEKHRKSSRAFCLNTFHDCQYPQCIHECEFYDANVYKNIEYLKENN
jgi:hypothetical protein